MVNEDDGLSSEDLLRQARESFDTPAVADTPDLAGSDALLTPPPLPAPPAATPTAAAAPSGSEALLRPPPSVPSAPPVVPPRPPAQPAVGATGSAARPAYVSPPATPPPVVPPPVVAPPVVSQAGFSTTAPAPGSPVASGMRPPEPPPRLQQAPPRAPQQAQGYKPASKLNKIPWGPVVAAVVVGIFLLIGFFAGRGTTGADDIALGDCFEDPGLGDFSKVTDQDCALPHDIQVFATVRASPLTFPSLSDSDSDLAPPNCEDKFFELVFEGGILDDPSIVVPDDAVLGEIGERGTNFGGTNFCIIESPSGALEGSIVPGR